MLAVTKKMKEAARWQAAGEVDRGGFELKHIYNERGIFNVLVTSGAAELHVNDKGIDLHARSC